MISGGIKRKQQRFNAKSAGTYMMWVWDKQDRGKNWLDIFSIKRWHRLCLSWPSLEALRRLCSIKCLDQYVYYCIVIRVIDILLLLVWTPVQWMPWKRSRWWQHCMLPVLLWSIESNHRSCLSEQGETTHVVLCCDPAICEYMKTPLDDLHNVCTNLGAIFL